MLKIGDLRFELKVRPLHNLHFCPISASNLNFNPRNTKCIHVVKIIAFLELEQKLALCKNFKIDNFSILPIILFKDW